MNENHLSPDDPRLTAYALGELDEPERAAVEAALAANPALRAAIDDIHATATQLEAALATEPMPVASAVIVPHPPRARVLRFPVAYYIIGGLAAASFAVMVARYEPPTRIVRSERSKDYVEIPLNPALEADAKEGSEALAKAGTPIPTDMTPGGSAPLIPAAKKDEVAQSSAMAPPPFPTPLILAAAPEVSRGPASPADSLPNSGAPDLSKTAQAATAQGDVPQTARETGMVEMTSPPPAPVVDATTLAKYDKNRNGRLDADEITARQADQRKPVLVAQDKTVELSPFEVTTDTKGYYASNTMSGTRFNSKIEDMGSAITVVTTEQTANRVRGTSPNASERPVQRAANTESYGLRQDNEFVAVASEPLSTFAVDVDTASYSNVRRFLRAGELPPRDAVRIEELVNYFPYRYAPPADNAPFAATLEVASTPWEPKHRLVRIGLKGREVSQAARPAANLVFLLDVSGSMNAENRLPLVKESLRLLVGKLRADDRVAIVVYAGATGLALPSTPVTKASEILAALDELQPGGSTNGGMGIQLAYDIAKANFVTGGVNRVILCTDGDFNVGVTDRGELLRLIGEKAKSNVFLTVLGFGMGNLKDDTLELLADKGNGNYGYIDSRREAEKLLVEQVGGTLVTIAKDVKIQVEFNPTQVRAYRLLGYENRLLKKEDFNNDKIDAGEIGAGHAVTALYEVIPAGAADEPLPTAPVDELKYQRVVAGGRAEAGRPMPEAGNRTAGAGAPRANLQSAARDPRAEELLTVKIRYKEPTGDESKKLEFPLTDRGADFAAASGDFKFAAAVAGFGLALRTEPIQGGLLANAARWAEEGSGDDPGGYRAEFSSLAKQAQTLVR